MRKEYTNGCEKLVFDESERAAAQQSEDGGHPAVYVETSCVVCSQPIQAGAYDVAPSHSDAYHNTTIWRDNPLR